MASAANDCAYKTEMCAMIQHPICCPRGDPCPAPAEIVGWQRRDFYFAMTPEEDRGLLNKQ